MGKLDPEQMGRVDRSDLFSKLIELPDQLRTGWNTALAGDWELELDWYRHVILLGMGGSAIAGDLLAAVLGSNFGLPFKVNRHYDLPGFVDSDTLCIASSYSGNTEETLSAVESAMTQDAEILILSSGGRLAEMAEENSWRHYALPPGYPPRSALGYSLGVLLGLFRSLDADTLSDTAFGQALDFLARLRTTWTDLAHPENLPLQLAQQLQGRLPLMYSDQRWEGVGLRWKGQFNENSKSHAFYQALPEMSHNEIVGWERLEGTQTFYPALSMVFLKTGYDHPRVTRRMAVTRGIAQDKGVPVIEVAAQGRNRLEQLLYLVYLGDLASYYLAILYGADPTAIQSIDQLKAALSQMD